MERSAWAALLLAFVTIGASAQQNSLPSAQDQVTASTPQDSTPPPKPMADGTYIMDPAIKPPRIIKAVAAAFPKDRKIEGDMKVCLLSAIIGVKGVASIRSVQCPGGGDARMNSITAVVNSKYKPGLLNGQPVPVLVRLQVIFTSDRRPALPVILPTRIMPIMVDQSPKRIEGSPPKFSSAAVRTSKAPFVLVTALVNEAGLPTDIDIDLSAGQQADQEAIAAITNYRFTPAMKDGKPIDYRVAFFLRVD
jgi:TonB family protein